MKYMLSLMGNRCWNVNAIWQEINMEKLFIHLKLGLERMTYLSTSLFPLQLEEGIVLYILMKLYLGIGLVSLLKTSK